MRGGAATEFIWNGKSFSFLTYPGASSTFAQGINNRGEIAGYYEAVDASFHGFVATPSHT